METVAASPSDAAAAVRTLYDKSIAAGLAKVDFSAVVEPLRATVDRHR